MRLKSIFCACFGFLMHSSLLGINFNPNTIKPILPDQPVSLDCGANPGLSSVALLQAFPQSKIVAVEADPDVFVLLKNTAIKHPQIYPFHVALGDKNGVTPFYQAQNHRNARGQGSIFPQSKEHWYWKVRLSKKPTSIPMQTLDDFCSQHEIPTLDFLFLDMQGAEYSMLKASVNILDKVRAIYTEVLFEEIYDGAPLYDDLKALLEQRGFAELTLYKRHKSWGDVLFINTRFRE